MPKVKTSFQADWLKQKDGNGHCLEEWVEPTKSKYEVWCKLCQRTLQCHNRGLSQILVHADRKSHKDKASSLAAEQMVFKPKASKSVSGCNQLQLIGKKDIVMKAELLWALKVASNNYSYRSCDGLKELFCEMFSDSKTVKDFTMSSSKVSYLISEATGPYFHEQLVNDVKSSKSPFTIQFDELSNVQTKKQLDIHVRYWSELQQEVKVHHLRSFLLGCAPGKKIASCILEAVKDDDLELKQMIALESDGPNVNKTVWNIINESKKDACLPGLINIGSCSLHVIHNAFGKGIQSYGQDAVDFVINLHMFFKISASRCEAFREVQTELMLEQQKFLKHIECRWLTLQPAVERILKQWPALQKYFLEALPKQDNKIHSRANYTKIVRVLKASPKNDSLIQLHFLDSVSKIFLEFLTFFQREEPLIHLLHDHSSELVFRLLKRFISQNALDQKDIDDVRTLDLSDLTLQLSDDELEIGNDARRVLSRSISDEKRKHVLFAIREFYQVATTYLLNKLPACKSIVRDCKCLQPQVRSKPWTLPMVKELARKLMIDVNIDILSDEWRALQSENILEELYSSKLKLERIDHYWRKIFSMTDALGHTRYPTVTKVVKSALVLAHGNLDVERGFSQSGKSVTFSRINLAEASINALQSTKDGIKACGVDCHQIEISKRFLAMGRMAHASYQRRMEEEKERARKVKIQKEIETQKREALEKLEAEKKEAVKKKKKKNQKDFP